MGKEVILQIKDLYDKIYVLVREQSIHEAQKKFSQYHNLVFIAGDLKRPDIVCDEKIISELQSGDVSFIHMAASYNLKIGLQEAYMINVVGTQNVLAFAKKIPALQAFFYVSTIAISGDYRGLFYENDFERGQSFSNAYAKTKYDAEALVRSWDYPHCPKIIFRPGIIVGNSITGRIEKIDGPYYLINSLLKMKKRLPLVGMFLNKIQFLPFPFSSEAHLPFVAVDEVARFIRHALFSTPSGELVVYHVTGSRAGVRLKNFLEDVFCYYDLKIRPIALDRNRLVDVMAMLLGLPEEALDYLFANTIYDQENMQRDFPDFRFKEFASYKKNLFQYAEEHLMDLDSD